MVDNLRTFRIRLTSWCPFAGPAQLVYSIEALLRFESASLNISVRWGDADPVAVDLILTATEFRQAWQRLEAAGALSMKEYRGQSVGTDLPTTRIWLRWGRRGNTFGGYGLSYVDGYREIVEIIERLPGEELGRLIERSEKRFIRRRR